MRWGTAWHSDPTAPRERLAAARESGDNKAMSTQPRMSIAWIVIGAAIGVAIGVAMDNVTFGIGIGMALGIALGLALRRPN